MQNKGFTLLLLVVVVSITALFGFRPHGSFKPWVTSNAENTAVVFGEYGYLLGSVPEILHPQAADTALKLTLKLQLLNQHGPIFRTIVNLGGDCENNPISIGQWRTHIIVFQGCDYANRSAKVRLSVDIKNYIGTTPTLSIVFNNGAGELQLNGQSIISKPTVDIHPDVITGSALLVGNAPDGRHGWSGTLFDLTIERITEAGLPTEKSTLIRHFDFTKTSQPNLISDNSVAASHLEIPETGYFPTRHILEKTDITTLQGRLRFDVAINVIGFAPIGFALALFLFSWTGMSPSSVSIYSIMIATFFSLSIELSQAYIAGRESALHDLILNSVGAVLGVLAFRLLVLIQSLYARFTTRMHQT